MARLTLKQIFFSVHVASSFKFHELVPGVVPMSMADAAASMSVRVQAHQVSLLTSKWLIITEVTYSQSILFLKLALGFFFLRLAVDKWQRRTIYLAMFLSSTVNLFVSFWDIGVCGNPASYLLDIMQGKCVSMQAQLAVAYLQAAVNSVTDITLCAIPFFLMRGSKLPSWIRAYVTGLLVLATA
jgi:hypothetical protein